MFYDLNEIAAPMETVDSFSIGGVRYEIGEIPQKEREAVMSIDPEGEVVGSWRPIIARLLSVRNSDTPELTDDVVAAIIPVIAKRFHEGG